ncbi:MAG: glycoside hydrolase family 16 protein [Proteocatella sp.]
MKKKWYLYLSIVLVSIFFMLLISCQDSAKVYTYQDDFEVFNQEFWFKRSGILGRTNLRPENIILDNGELSIKLPGQTLDGGEIQSIDELGFGSYEVKMKLPDAPSSITGFFLYKEPDFYHEIDIEVYNEPKAYIVFTSYEDGQAANEHREYLNFDPTLDYHEYRIDYYSDKIAFYVDDKRMHNWHEGFSKEKMHLALNAWYPKWLGGIKQEEDSFLYVDWIRY